MRDLKGKYESRLCHDIPLYITKFRTRKACGFHDFAWLSRTGPAVPRAAFLCRQLQQIPHLHTQLDVDGSRAPVVRSSFWRDSYYHFRSTSSGFDEELN